MSADRLEDWVPQQNLWIESGAPAGTRIPGAVEGVAPPASISSTSTGSRGELCYRYFGPRPLLEDNSVGSRSSNLVNAGVGYAPRTSGFDLDLFNLLNARVSDVDYVYTSCLPGEPAAGIDDVTSTPWKTRRPGGRDHVILRGGGVAIRRAAKAATAIATPQMPPNAKGGLEGRPSLDHCSSSVSSEKTITRGMFGGDQEPLISFSSNQTSAVPLPLTMVSWMRTEP